jgi:hypothetical protein
MKIDIPFDPITELYSKSARIFYEPSSRWYYSIFVSTSYEQTSSK